MAISLKKAEETVRISLKKKDIVDPPISRVGLALDISGSMDTSYRNGTVSDIVTRILALAKTFDDNGEMDMWAFNTNSYSLDVATEDNYETYVREQVINAGMVGGGTSYSPCINAITKFYFPKNRQAVPKHITRTEEVQKTGFFAKLFGLKETVTFSEPNPAYSETDPNDLPAFVVFLTDGENQEQQHLAEAAFKASTKEKIYWLLVGVGTNKSHFKFLNDTANKYDNVSYLQFDHLDIEDEELYDSVISQKFIDWAA